MHKCIYNNAILIDTSAVIALKDSKDRYHKHANIFFESTEISLWVVLNETTHESYTRARYDFDFEKAIEVHNFLTDDAIMQIAFNKNDEKLTIKMLEKYAEHSISFHDALCAVVMKKVGIYKVFTFDKHFWTFGFEVVPGQTI